MSNIPLTLGMKTSLLSLQNSQKLFEQVQERLTTGKKVNKPTDDPAAYYAAVRLYDHARDLEGRLDGMGQAVQAIKAADGGVTAIRSVLSNMKSIVENALTTSEDDAATRQSLGKKFNDLLLQLKSLAEDSGYGGVNLLVADQKIDVQLGQGYNDSTFTVQGFHIAGAARTDADGNIPALTAADVPANWEANDAEIGQYAFALNSVEDPTSYIGIKAFGTTNTGATGHEVDWGSDNFREDLTGMLNSIDKVSEMLKTRSKLLSFDQNTITLREDYTQQFVSTLEGGADKLTLADLNEEAANLLALQTSQQLGVQALSLSNQQTQGVLRLLS